MTDVWGVLRTATLLAFGACEGYAFATSGMGYPYAFRSQMNFSHSTLLRVFLSAAGSSMLAQGLLSLVAPKVMESSRKWKKTNVGFPRVIGGSLLLGIGMAVAGSGPTMLPTQIGVGAGHAWYTLLGCLAGGSLYSLLEDRGVFSGNFAVKCDAGKSTMVVEEKFGGSYPVWSLSLGTALVAGSFLGVPLLFDTTPTAAATTLSPSVAGLSVGLAQIPIRYITGGGQGGSTSIVSVLGSVTNVGKRHRLKLSLSSAGQVLYVWGGTLAGAVLASHALGLPAPAGFSPAESFLGGALMLFGARIANGCACGHGVSGFSELSFQSMASTAAIFGGGIATVVLLGLPVKP